MPEIEDVQGLKRVAPPLPGQGAIIAAHPVIWALLYRQSGKNLIDLELRSGRCCRLIYDIDKIKRL